MTGPEVYFGCEGRLYAGRDTGSTWNGFANPELRAAEAVRFVHRLAEATAEAGFPAVTVAAAYGGDEADGLTGLLMTYDDGPGGPMVSESFGPDADGWWPVGWGYTWEGPFDRAEAEAYAEAYGVTWEGARS